MKTLTKTTLLGAMALLISSQLSAADASIDEGKTLYKKCAACHGQNGERKAMGKSNIINELDEATVEQRLAGYKDGSYGGSMKGIMKGQVANYNDTQIKSLAMYISSIKKD
jgi:cytochrome c553